MTLSEREERWEDALMRAIDFWDHDFDRAAVMAVADAEQADLRAEVAELRHRLDQRTQALHRTAQAKDTAEAALADERAKVARVEAVLDRSDAALPMDTPVWVLDHLERYADEIRDALVDPEPDTTKGGA